MADKILNTRILLKYDTWVNWNTYNPVLKKGELAIVEIPAEAGAVVQEPNYLLKVGDGSKTFKALDFIAAKAADVHSWAKASAKPSYTIEEIGGYDAIDTDTQYRLVQDTSDAHVIKLQSKAKNGSEWSVAATITTADTIYDDTGLINRIAALEAKVGVITVEEAIEAYVTSLDLPNTYDAKGSADQALADAKSYADGQLAAKAAELSAATQQAQDAADTAQGEVDALERYVGTFTPVSTESTVVGYVDAKVAQINSANNALTGRVTAVEEQAAENASAIEDLEDYVGTFSPVNGETTVVGYVDAKTEKVGSDLTALAGRVSANEANIADNTAALATLNGEGVGSVKKTAEDAANAAVNTFASNLTENGSVDTFAELVNYVAEHGATVEGFVAKDQEHDDAIAALNAKVDTGDKTVSSYVADQIAAQNLDQYATDAEMTAAVGRIAANEASIASLTEDKADKSTVTALTNTVNTKAAQTDLDAAVVRIAANEANVADLQNVKANAADVESSISSLTAVVNTKAAQTDLDTAVGRITALESADAEQDTLLSGLRTDLDAEVSRAQAAESKNETAITEVKASVDSLANIARTGSTDDLVQGTMTLIFDCGDSNV